MARREHAARHAGLLAVAQARGVHLADGHRRAAAYLRATCNASDATIARDRKLARLLDAHPAVGDALLAGRISVDQAVECGSHNPFKHRERWKTRRDRFGRSYTVRADGTIVLTVGERAPDLSADEFAEITRARLAELIAS